MAGVEDMLLYCCVTLQQKQDARLCSITSQSKQRGLLRWCRNNGAGGAVCTQLVQARNLKHTSSYSGLSSTPLTFQCPQLCQCSSSQMHIAKTTATQHKNVHPARKKGFLVFKTCWMLIRWMLIGLIRILTRTLGKRSGQCTATHDTPSLFKYTSTYIQAKAENWGFT